MDSASRRYAMHPDASAARVAPPGAMRPGPARGRRLLTRLSGASLIAAMAALLLAAPVAASRSTLFVSPSGSDTGPCSWASPCQTIGHAVDAAAPGSRIVVRAGTYHEAVVIPKRLTVVGRHAVIDADGILASVPGPLGDQGIIGWGVLIVGPGSAGTVFRGFTVENAPAEGILAALTSRVRIKHNELLHNDTGATTAFDPLPFECAAQGEIPGDCGEALHLLSVSDSRVAWNNVHDNVGGILLTDEAGPTFGNVVAHNVSRDNLLDCGITLPSHNPAATTDPTLGGVYDNTILGNRSIGNGGAGVGMFAAGPGMASYDNRVIGNVLRDNGEAGVAIHSHTPGQNVSGNLIAANVISGNGIDPDFQSADAVGPQNTGIAVGSVADPVNVRIVGNWISNEYWGLYRSGTIHVSGLWSNHFARSVTHRYN
jgi:Periplasmic copper-binding protein (NosD)